jgi:hypothetical protein
VGRGQVTRAVHREPALAAVRLEPALEVQRALAVRLEVALAVQPALAVVRQERALPRGDPW